MGNREEGKGPFKALLKNRLIAKGKPTWQTYAAVHRKLLVLI